MKPEFVKCEFCKVKIPEKICELSAVHRVISGRDYLFCCGKCAERYEQKIQSSRKK